MRILTVALIVISLGSTLDVLAKSDKASVRIPDDVRNAPDAAKIACKDKKDTGKAKIDYINCVRAYHQ